MLRRRILSGFYPAGSPLSLRTLAEDLNVSPTPVRDALVELEHEGLIQRLPNRSVVIAEVTFSDMCDAFTLRYHLMDLLSELAVKNLTENHLSDLRKIIADVDLAGTHGEVALLDERFHETLNAAAGNALLKRCLENARAIVKKIWQDERGMESEASRRQRAENLTEIVDAIERKDIEACRKALQDHLMGFVDSVRDALLAVDREGSRERRQHRADGTP